MSSARDQRKLNRHKMPNTCNQNKYSAPSPSSRNAFLSILAKKNINKKKTKNPNRFEQHTSEVEAHSCLQSNHIISWETSDYCLVVIWLGINWPSLATPTSTSTNRKESAKKKTRRERSSHSFSTIERAKLKS